MDFDMEEQDSDATIRPPRDESSRQPTPAEDIPNAAPHLHALLVLTVGTTVALASGRAFELLLQYHYIQDELPIYWYASIAPVLEVAMAYTYLEMLQREVLKGIAVGAMVAYGLD